jgi:probable HAF family extracellular repeat protein
MQLRDALVPISLLLLACQDSTAPAPTELGTPVAVRSSRSDTLYDLIDLGPATRGFQLPELLLNNTDLLAVNLLLPDGARTQVWRLGPTPEMELLSPALTTARAINDRGEIVGGYRAASGRTRAFRWADGTLTDLGTLGGDQSEAFAISKHGVVVGEAALADGSIHAFRWERGAMADLGTLGGRSSRATGINIRGDITGYSATGPSPYITRTFRWRHGKLIDLGPITPGASPDDNSPLGIADDGTSWSSSLPCRGAAARSPAM